MATVKRVPARSEVDPKDCWDLSSLYPNDATWEEDLKKYKELIPGFETFAASSQTPTRLAECLRFDTQVDLLSERWAPTSFKDDRRSSQ